MRDVLQHVLDPEGPFLAMMDVGLRGLTDAEYLWEPVEYCWSVRPVDQLRTPVPPWSSGEGWSAEIVYPDPDPSPFTTIAWRMVHMTGSVDVAAATIIGRRREDGAIDGAFSATRSATPRTASAAVEQWNEAIRRLRTHVDAASEEDLLREERQWWDAPDHRAPVWQQVLYFAYFEPASHGAEVRLVRDLFRHTSGGSTALRPA